MSVIEERLRAALVACVAQLQEDICTHEGTALTVCPTLAGRHGELLQKARSALGADPFIPPWLLEEADEPEIVGEDCYRCGGSGGGDDPALQCRACNGTGARDCRGQ